VVRGIPRPLNLLFTYELQRTMEAAGKNTIAVAAHPGMALPKKSFCFFITDRSDEVKHLFLPL
jgi:hypothetical protein